MSYWWRYAIVFIVLLVAGCAGNPLYRQWQPQLERQPSIAELASVPFYPQESYQCGPAALATVLTWAGDAVAPDALTEQLFIEGRRGSLQIEMLAATRRHGLVPYEHPGGLDDLFAQLAAGVPVVVLQNLGVGWMPTWHYAVVVGYDAGKQAFLLRSGPEQRLWMQSRDLARSWKYSDQWMMTVHSAGDIPVGATALEYVRAVTGLERVQHADAALASYRAAVEHWPESVITWMALGNALYGSKHFVEAEQAYRAAYQLDPEQPAAAHNLAWALIEQGKRQQALPYAQKAANVSEQARYQSALQALR